MRGHPDAEPVEVGLHDHGKPAERDGRSPERGLPSIDGHRPPSPSAWCKLAAHRGAPRAADLARAPSSTGSPAGWSGCCAALRVLPEGEAGSSPPPRVPLEQIAADLLPAVHRAPRRPAGGLPGPQARPAAGVRRRAGARPRSRWTCRTCWASSPLGMDRDLERMRVEGALRGGRPAVRAAQAAGHALNHRLFAAVVPPSTALDHLGAALAPAAGPARRRRAGSAGTPST